MNKQLIEAALEWAAQGVPVFPCKPNKAPLTENGHLDASTDPRVVKELFEFYGENAEMIGGRMGEESGLFAVDFDLYKPGVESYAHDLKERGLLPDTRTHKTMRGGLHLIYAGTEQPNCKPHSGVEVKGEGGYIILPPSKGYSVVQEGVVDAPSKLITEFKQARRARAILSDQVLESSILSGDDFHESITQLTARLATRGKSQHEIQKYIMEVMDASVAKNPRHRRHERWSQIMRDAGGELTRAVKSATQKYDHSAASDALAEAIGLDSGAQEVALEAGFFDTPHHREEEHVEIPEGAWPFEGEGYFAHEDRDVHSASFTMYPIYAENETTVIFAEPKTGKTALAITHGLHIAAGYDFGPLKVDGQGLVLYYGLEGKRAIELRIESWKRARRDAGQPVPDNLPFFAIEKSNNFIEESVRKREAAKIVAASKYAAERNAPLKMVVIDTLTKAMSGGDQNSVEDTSSLFEFVNLLRDEGVTASIVFVHHKSRQGNVRGSTNIEAEPDVLLDVSKEGSIVNMYIARARSIEDGQHFSYKLHGYDLGKNAQGYVQSGLYVEALDAPPADGASGDMREAEDRAKMLSILSSLEMISQDNYVDANDFIKELHNQKFITTKHKPKLTTKAAQSLLNDLVPDKGGKVFADRVIRPEYDKGYIVGFTLMSLT